MRNKVKTLVESETSFAFMSLYSFVASTIKTYVRKKVEKGGHAIDQRESFKTFTLKFELFFGNIWKQLQ